MILVDLGQHVEKSVHGDVQIGLARDRLKGLRNRCFAGATGAVEEEDAGYCHLVILSGFLSQGCPAHAWRSLPPKPSAV